METIYDGMEARGWTKESSHQGLKAFMECTVLAGNPCYDFSSNNDESYLNQLLTFMVRDIEKATK